MDEVVDNKRLLIDKNVQILDEQDVEQGLKPGTSVDRILGVTITGLRPEVESEKSNKKGQEIQKKQAVEQLMYKKDQQEKPPGIEYENDEDLLSSDSSSIKGSNINRVRSIFCAVTDTWTVYPKWTTRVNIRV